MHIRLTRASTAALAVATLALTGLVPAAPPASPAAAGAPRVVFRLWLDDGCFAGKGPASTRLTFTLRKPSGALVDTLVRRTSGTGAFDACFEDGELRTGYKLAARKGTTTLRTLTLPRLVVRSNRAADSIGVNGPRGARLSLVVTDCNRSPDSCPQVLERKGTLSSTGTYATDITSGHDALGHDAINATIRTGAGDAISRSSRFPFIVASLDTTFYGNANPGSTVRIRLKAAPGGTVLSSTTQTPGSDGRFSGPATLSAGRELSADFAVDARITIPAASVAYDPASNAMSGTCLPGGGIILIWFTDTMNRVGATADGGGAWAVDLDDALKPAPPPGALLQVTCNSAAGDQVYHLGDAPS